MSRVIRASQSCIFDCHFVERAAHRNLCNTEKASDSGVEKIGERTSLLWKLSEKKGAGETDFDEHVQGQVNTKRKRQRHRSDPLESEDKTEGVKKELGNGCATRPKVSGKKYQETVFPNSRRQFSYLRCQKSTPPINQPGNTRFRRDVLEGVRLFSIFRGSS